MSRSTRVWDCKYCGHKKLLGITHRFCGGCGAPQDPNARYFPPDNEKVAVQNHPYVGADVACPACRQPMSRAAACCTNCGSPIDKGVEVARRADVVLPAPGALPAGGMPFGGAPSPGGVPFQGAPFSAGGATPQTPKKSSSTWIFALLGGVLFVIVSMFLVAVFWKREGVFEVTGHSWERSIAIERRDAVRKSTWCDDVPSGARVLGRHEEQKGTKKEADGQECGMRKKDLGNGSYKEVKECKPKYKDVPVMEDKCDIEVIEWRNARTLAERGRASPRLRVGLKRGFRAARAPAASVRGRGRSGTPSSSSTENAGPRRRVTSPRLSGPATRKARSGRARCA